MKLGEKIRKLRQDRKISIEDMAKDLGINERTYSDIENDKSKYIERLEKIAKIFNISPEDILKSDEKNLNVQIGDSENDNYSNSININVQPSEILKKENEYLKSENENLKKIIGLLEENKKPIE